MKVTAPHSTPGSSGAGETVTGTAQSWARQSSQTGSARSRSLKARNSALKQYDLYHHQSCMTEKRWRVTHDPGAADAPAVATESQRLAQLRYVCGRPTAAEVTVQGVPQDRRLHTALWERCVHKTCTHTHTHMRAHTRHDSVSVCPQKPTHLCITHPRTHIHAHTYMCTHVHTRAHTRTHPHTHSCA